MTRCTFTEQRSVGLQGSLRFANLNEYPHEVPCIILVSREHDELSEDRQCTMVIMAREQVFCITPQGVLVGRVEVDGRCILSDRPFITLCFEHFCEIAVDV